MNAGGDGRREIRRIVVKLGTSSITGEDGAPNRSKIKKVTDQIADLATKGVQSVIVSSGAIAAGMQELALSRRPSDMPTLQAAAAVGQRRLMDLYADLLGKKGITVGQVLLTQLDIVQRRHYLNARHTLDRLMELGCVPVVNENDTVGTEEIRYGDNDRLAALVANIVRADLLVMLSDVEGLYDSHPGKSGASLLEVVNEITPEIMRSARGMSSLGSGGMATKLEAARMATMSSVGVVIASAARPHVLSDIQARRPVGTYFPAHASKIQSRKLWIAWAPSARGRIQIDDGAVRALVTGKKSLLAAGVIGVAGTFAAGDAVEVTAADGRVVAKGLVGFDAEMLTEIAGTRAEREVIHRDQLVVLQ
ncbi:MAG: glutamate 5-kinase [Actinomycetota bacterium]